MHQETVINCDSFASPEHFASNWNIGYPWSRYPNEHNGTARMTEECVKVADGELTLVAKWLGWEEGKSGHDPYLPIRYHSGAIHAKTKFCINTVWPKWELKGEFQAPSVRGTWPAFWITGIDGNWPPEIDILEFKGTNENWQNTFHEPNRCDTQKTVVDSSNEWHEYRVWIELKAHNNVEIHYFIDNDWKVCHQAPSKIQDLPMDIIINLQMEGSSGEPGPRGETLFKARNVYVGRSK
jgi:galactan endo-beta-1,3-galactanase